MSYKVKGRDEGTVRRANRALGAYIARRLGCTRWTVISDTNAAHGMRRGPDDAPAINVRQLDDFSADFLADGGDPAAVDLRLLNAARALRGQPPIERPSAQEAA